MNDYKIDSKDFVEKQYSVTDNLQKRISFHKKTNTNKQSIADWLADIYDFSKPCTILELGSGTGSIWPAIIPSMNKDAQLMLSDFSQGMVDNLAALYKDNANITARQIDIQDIPFEDNTFDYVIANYMLYHVPDIDKAIAEVARVLKPQGTFYSATSGRHSMITFFSDTLRKLDSTIIFSGTLTFTMENGAQYLTKHFNNVILEPHINSSIVTDVDDILEYYYSTLFSKGIKHLERDMLSDYYESIKDDNGEIHIPLDNGTFIAKNI